MQRVRSLGVRAASPIDLMAIAMSRREGDVTLSEPAARTLIRRLGSMRGLSEASASDLAAGTGLEDFEVLRLMATLELGRRTREAGRGEIEEITGPDDVAYLLDHLRHEKKEHFVAVLLDSKNGVMRVAHIHSGTVNMSIVGLREVFREAVRDGASSLIVAHNHPSGDPEPSPEDIEVTWKLVEAGELLDIPVRDHVIIGERRHVSLASRMRFGG